MNATEIYLGPLGKEYHRRNRAFILANQTGRAQAIRSLFSDFADDPWCEIGCGIGVNLNPRDVGVDIDPRNNPTITANILDLPLPTNTFSVVFCVGLLMHLPDGKWQKGLTEMARVAKHGIIIGEYESVAEHDLLWDPYTGKFGHGTPNLVWERPYSPPKDWLMKGSLTTFPVVFGDEVTFSCYIPEI